MVDYKMGEPLRVYTNRGWWKKPSELLMWPGDRLTVVPVQVRKRIGLFRRFLLAIYPEFWRRHLRKKAHRKYLAQLGIHDPKTIKAFGSEEHLLDEMMRVKGLPPIELLPFDSRRRTNIERAEQLRAQLKEAFEQFRKQA